jgi:tRNA A58 N-methylase Trm61
LPEDQTPREQLAHYLANTLLDVGVVVPVSVKDDAYKIAKNWIDEKWSDEQVSKALARAKERDKC